MVHPDESASLRKKRSNRWNRLWKRLKRKGVVEVDIDHHRYKLLECIRTGIQEVINTDQGQTTTQDIFNSDDLGDVITREITSSSGKKCVFKSYASSVFASIRKAVGISESEYLHIIAPPTAPYLEFISNSKSGQDFYLSNDQQYILKTDKKYYIDFFLTFLGDYLEHFQIYPHSLIVKFLGLYSVEMPRQPKKFFLAMQNVFFPPERIDVRYDVKGCLGGRYQQPPPADSEVLTILKDKNFKDLNIDLGLQKDWFLRQLDIDVGFLRELGVQDYSLLIGVHTVHKQENKPSLPSLVLRMKKSFPDEMKPSKHKHGVLPPLKIPGKNRVFQTDEGSTEEAHYLPPAQLNDTFSAQNNIQSDQRVLRHSVSRECSSDSFKREVSSLSSLLESRTGLDPAIHNQRLLLNCKNPLHVIDGPDFRYYLGIIDFFTKYECRQRFARVMKTIKLCTTDHSTVPPDQYAERFKKFIGDRTLGMSKMKSDL